MLKLGRHDFFDQHKTLKVRVFVRISILVVNLLKEINLITKHNAL